MMSPSADICQQIDCAGVTRKEKYFAGRKEAPNENHGLYPIHVWHGDIADNEIGLYALGDLDGVGAGIDGGCIEASLVEDDCQRVGNGVLIVHYQYLGHIGHSFLFWVVRDSQ